MTPLRVFSPLPLAGEGPGVRACDGTGDGLHFVDIPALTPTLSRKRERELWWSNFLRQVDRWKITIDEESR
ncbi:hypothetical protein CBM2586_B30002 [Cupriavidus phytorum]|uniref:Uncharacterized protein n=1 Tax=Cupriavidus taiwanensis TaxID=164546 RepID=A0A975XJB1_9BURK|nr:hypothetical protein CBM2586_B30002 [Cupriavidus taiwanensis]